MKHFKHILVPVRGEILRKKDLKHQKSCFIYIHCGVFKAEGLHLYAQH